MLYQFWIAYPPIARKEVRRFMRIWVQTIFPPVITVALYFVIFGNLIGERIGEMDGLAYIDFIMPGPKQACPMVAACWSPATPVIGMLVPNSAGSV